jgi:RNase adapter protein RapZ
MSTQAGVASTFVVVSGLSGAGKTTALQTLEECGYFTADNLPPGLYGELCKLCLQQQIPRVAAVSDARTRYFLGDIEFGLATVANSLGIEPSVVFLEAEDEVLLRRYNLTRRAHPLHESSLLVNFREERAVLAHIRGLAEMIIDTSSLSARQLGEVLRKRFGDAHQTSVRLFSFGFKHGAPRDADLVLDVRSLPNPFYDERLRPLTGLDDEVSRYVFAGDAASLDSEAFYGQIRYFIEQNLKNSLGKNRYTYTIGIGCTGGQHRSVAVTERLSRDLSGYTVVVEHRDIHKKHES